QIKEFYLETLQGEIWKRFDMDERIRASAEKVLRKESNPLGEVRLLLADTGIDTTAREVIAEVAEDPSRPRTEAG
ncbi:MAG: hypothetical protein WC712_13710, partial [Candidatus Brocadiia bacterium]